MNIDAVSRNIRTDIPDLFYQQNEFLLRILTAQRDENILKHNDVYIAIGIPIFSKLRSSKLQYSEWAT